MANESVDTASAFTIKELTGRQRTLRMVARGLPYRPFSLLGTQRVETTWYPGNPEATATVLGAAEEPTTINGFWKDKYLSAGSGNSATGGNQVVPLSLDGERLETARAASRAVDDIRRQGQLLEVTWDEQVRQGHITRFEQDWHNVHDLEWRIELTWIGQGDSASQSSSASQQTSVSDTSDVMTKQSTDLQTASVAPFPLPTSFQEDITEQLAGIQASVGQLKGTVTNLAASATTPFDATRRTLAITTSLVDKARALADTFQAQPARALNASVTDINVLSQGQVIAAEAYARGVVSIARNMARSAVIRRQILARAIQSDLLGTYLAREGDDLRTVSQRFYRTPFEWRRLAAFNELTSPELSIGQLVLVPRIQNGGS